MLAVRERALGLEHLEVAASTNNLAVLLKLAGSSDEAEALYLRSIRIKQAALGPNHPQVYPPQIRIHAPKPCWLHLLPPPRKDFDRGHS